MTPQNNIKPKKSYKMPQKCYPKGNQWYKLVKAKTGRPPIFASPDEMGEKFLEYVQFSEQNPIIKKEAIKSGENAGLIIDIPVERPLTIYGFAAFVGMSVDTWHDHLNNKKEFSEVCQKIKAICDTHKLNGAMAGNFNANIVTRLLGLADKTEATNTHEVTVMPKIVKNGAEIAFDVGESAE